MKKQKVCALFCIAAISMSLATPAKADDRYPSLNETEETLNEKENQEEYELPDDIVVDSNNQSQEQQTTEEGTCYVNGKAYLFDQNGAMIKAIGYFYTTEAITESDVDSVMAFLSYS